MRAKPDMKPWVNKRGRHKIKSSVGAVLQLEHLYSEGSAAPKGAQ